MFSPSLFRLKKYDIEFWPSNVLIHVVLFLKNIAQFEEINRTVPLAISVHRTRH